MLVKQSGRSRGRAADSRPQRDGPGEKNKKGERVEKEESWCSKGSPGRVIWDSNGKRPFLGP